MSANGGVWPAQYLADYSRHWSIRHPRGLKSKKSEDQENYEKVQIKLADNLKEFLLHSFLRKNIISDLKVSNLTIVKILIRFIE